MLAVWATGERTDAWPQPVRGNGLIALANEDAGLSSADGIGGDTPDGDAVATTVSICLGLSAARRNRSWTLVARLDSARIRAWPRAGFGAPLTASSAVARAGAAGAAGTSEAPLITVAPDEVEGSVRLRDRPMLASQRTSALSSPGEKGLWVLIDCDAGSKAARVSISAMVAAKSVARDRSCAAGFQPAAASATEGFASVTGSDVRVAARPAAPGLVVRVSGEFGGDEAKENGPAASEKWGELAMGRFSTSLSGRLLTRACRNPVGARSKPAMRPMSPALSAS